MIESCWGRRASINLWVAPTLPTSSHVTSSPPSPPGRNLSATLPVLAELECATNRLVARVRATNGVGLTSIATSANALLRLTRRPVLLRLLVERFELSETCTLNSTGAVSLRWEPQSNGAESSGSLVQYTVRVEDESHQLLIEASAGSSHNVTVTVSALDGSELFFVVVMTDQAGLSTQRELRCLVDTTPPTVGALLVTSGRAMPNRTANLPTFTPPVTSAHLPSSRLTMCWHGFSDDHSGVVQFVYSVRRVRDGVELHAEAVFPSKAAATAALHWGNFSAAVLEYGVSGVASASRLEMEVQGGSGPWCADATVTLAVGEAYIASVQATNRVGLRSEAAVSQVTVDASGPELRGLLVHTDAPPPVQAGSACCLRFSWDAPVEKESYLVSSGICFETNGAQPKLCTSLGRATRLLVGDGSCDCLPPAEAALGKGEWTAVDLAPPVLERLGLPVVRGHLWAENMMELRTELAFNIQIDRLLWAPPLNLRRISAADSVPALGDAPTHTIADASCLPEGLDAAHSMTSALQLSWDSNASSPRFRLCMHMERQPSAAATGGDTYNLQGEPPCSIVSALNASLGLQPPGTYLINVSTEIGPSSQTASMRIAIDGSPPTLGQLRLGDNVSIETGTLTSYCRASLPMMYLPMLCASLL